MTSSDRVEVRAIIKFSPDIEKTPTDVTIYLQSMRPVLSYLISLVHYSQWG